TPTCTNCRDIRHEWNRFRKYYTSTLGLLSCIGNYGNNSNCICFIFHQERMDSSWKRQVGAKTRVLIIYLSKLMNVIDYNVLYIGFGYLMANYWQALG